MPRVVCHDSGEHRTSTAYKTTLKQHMPLLVAPLWKMLRPRDEEWISLPLEFGT